MKYIQLTPLVHENYFYFLRRCSVLFAGIGSTTHTPDFKAGTRRISGVRGYRAGLERLDKFSNQFWNVLFGSPVFQQLQAVTLLSKPTKHAFILPSIHSFKHFPPKMAPDIYFFTNNEICVLASLMIHNHYDNYYDLLCYPSYIWCSYFVYKLESDCSIYFL